MIGFLLAVNVYKSLSRIPIPHFFFFSAPHPKLNTPPLILRLFKRRTIGLFWSSNLPPAKKATAYVPMLGDDRYYQGVRGRDCAGAAVCSGSEIKYKFPILTNRFRRTLKTYSKKIRNDNLTTAMVFEHVLDPRTRSGVVWIAIAIYHESQDSEKFRYGLCK